MASEHIGPWRSTLSMLVTQATGAWAVNGATHTLECDTPDGHWETQIVAQLPLECAVVSDDMRADTWLRSDLVLP